MGIVELHQLIKRLREQQMSRPWDSLRKPVKSPIGEGAWTTRHMTRVQVSDISHNCKITIGSSQNWFMPSDLRELAEFCTELADQIEGK